MPLEIDLASWPVAVIARGADDRAAANGAAGPAEPVGPLLGSLLDRRERFGLVLHLGRQTEGEQADFGAWLRTHRVRVRRYIAAGALVVPPGAVTRGRDLIGARPDLYPFPAWVAGSVGECRAWVEGVLASSGPARRSRRR